MVRLYLCVAILILGFLAYATIDFIIECKDFKYSYIESYCKDGLCEKGKENFINCAPDCRCEPIGWILGDKDD